MIVDSSALVAILAREPERERFIEAIVASTECSVAAPTMLETSIVLGKFGPQVAAALRELIREAKITIVSFDEEHLAAAEDAYRRFGRGTGHVAQLNFGDCFSYAASVVSGRPLLFKGDDFVHTDVLAALS